MRALRSALAAGLCLSMAAGVTSASITAATADEDVPTRQDVQAAQDDAAAKARDVAAVQADLVRANDELRQSSVAAAQAAEAYNGAVWRAEQADKEARAAQRSANRAQRDVDRQQQVYGQALVRSYEVSPTLTGLSAVTRAEGIESVIRTTATMQNAEEALDGRYDAFRAAATLAELATERAEAQREEAEELRRQAGEARAAAQGAAEAAAAQAEAIAATKADLVDELAELEGISVELAQQRQTALEDAAQAAAAEAARKAAAQEAAQEAAQAVDAATQATDASGNAGQEASPPEESPQPAPEPAPSTPTPPTTPTLPTPPTPPAPSPAGGAAAAIAFAEAQLGEPYVWGAAGPDSWDCSGLTAGAWAQGGKYLPHYSVAQYTQSTPISPSQLAPGDLLFWGSSNDPSSIYHVALYVGGGQMIHAPRTGRPVTRESMYYWIPPNFHARP